MYFLDETEENTYRLMDALRLVPEVDHLKPGTRIAFAVKPKDGDLTREHFLRRFLRSYPPEHLDPRLSKYRPLSIFDLRGDFGPALLLWCPPSAPVQALG